MAGKKFHNKTMTSLGFHFFLLWSQWGRIPQFMNLEINLEFHIWKQMYFFWCSKKLFDVPCGVLQWVSSALWSVTRHQVSRDCRCAESPLTSLGSSHRTTSSEAVPAKGPKAQKAQGQEGLKALQVPRRPYKSLQGTHIMSLEAERRVDKEKGKVGIIKKVCESKSNPTSLTSSFLKATFEGGFSSWTCHTQEKRPALMITRYLLLSFYCKTFEF